MGAWAKFPTKWIRPPENGLRSIVWRKHKGDSIAALLVLISLAVKRNRDKMERSEENTAIVKATYDKIQDLVGISRSKIAKGLALLMELKIIEHVKNKTRSYYRIIGLDVAGSWAKLPQELLMQQPGHIFEPFNLRSKSELDALKIYLLLLAFRNDMTGYTNIGYDKITKYTGVIARNIKKAKSHLISLGLIYVDSDKEDFMEEAKHPPMRYKILGLKDRRPA